MDAFFFLSFIFFIYLILYARILELGMHVVLAMVGARH